MFISVLELFKIGIGPSSSHTLGPMVAAHNFIQKIETQKLDASLLNHSNIECTLKGSLAFTGKGHATDRAVTLGLHGYLPNKLIHTDIEKTISQLSSITRISLPSQLQLNFDPSKNILFDTSETLPEHPNGMVFKLRYKNKTTLLSETYFSIGGGFINTKAEITRLEAPLKMDNAIDYPYPFDSAKSMLKMSQKNRLSIASMKRVNELKNHDETELINGLNSIWGTMKTCIERGLSTKGKLPGGLNISRRAKHLYQHIKQHSEDVNINDWLCAYAMAVNEENAAGNLVVTAPTNGAAGVIPAILYFGVKHKKWSDTQVHDFLLTASAIGGLIKHLSSISGAEVGCQGEVGSASAMAAAGLCEVLGGTPNQIENAAEIALEHHLGMTCDPVQGLVQIPCIERNGFGAIKAYTAASLALRGTGEHFMPLDNCIAAMKQTGLEMSHKYKETSLGGLAVSLTEC